MRRGRSAGRPPALRNGHDDLEAANADRHGRRPAGPSAWRRIPPTRSLPAHRQAVLGHLPLPGPAPVAGLHRVPKHFGFDGWLAGAPSSSRRTEHRLAGSDRQAHARAHHYPAPPQSGWTRGGQATAPSTHMPAAHLGVPLHKVGLPDAPPKEWEDVFPQHLAPAGGLPPGVRLDGKDGVVGPAVGLRPGPAAGSDVRVV